MIVPSVDLIDGSAVQLRMGEALVIDAGDPTPIFDRFARVGEVAVVDLDGARGEGDNAAVMEALCRRGRCRVGGGIRSAEAALRWLDAGATKVVLGTAATPEVLAGLPADRVVAALDARDGEVVVEGWRSATGESVEARMARLSPYVGEFLVTFVENEGRLTGMDVERARKLKELAGDRRLTVAGGVKDAEDVAKLDAIGVDVQVGMALYDGRLDLGDAIAGMLSSDREDGLYPTVVTDPSGRALGLCWSNDESLREAIRSGTGVYWSRRRGLWRKGESSGATQELLRLDLDCDRDAIRFVVRQAGAGFCHLDTPSCWGEGWGLDALERTVDARKRAVVEGSYTQRLFSDASLRRSKLVEEAGELGDAESRDEVVHEAADVLYFTAVAMASAGVSFEDVGRELDRRALRVSRRGGDAKPGKGES